MADFTGTAADDVFNALATSGATAAAATTVNSGDTIDGGAGNDTLNIIATATNNTSLAGLVVKSIETVNITDANNLGGTSSSTAAASAGAKQVQVLDIGNLSLVGEEQTISFVGQTASGTTVGVNVNGTSVSATTVALDGGAAVATAVAAAINTAAGTTGNALKDKVTATATSGVVTLKFVASVGEAATSSVTSGLTGSPTINAVETKQSSAELQALTIAGTGAVTVTANGTVSATVLGVTVTTGQLTAAADASAIASALRTAINNNSDLTGKVVASGSTNVVNLTYAASVGNAAEAVLVKTNLNDGAGGLAANIAAVETRKGGEVGLNVTVNGAQYSTKAVLDGSILTATGDTLTAAQNANKDAARDAIKALLAPIVSDAFVIGNSDEAGEIKLTSNTVGTAAPTITAAGRNSASNLIIVDPLDAATVANAAKTGATTVAQQVQYTFGGTVDDGDGFTLYIDGTNYGTGLGGANATPSTIAAQFAAAVNGVLGAGSAVATGGSVTITAPVAGTPLPVITVTEVDPSASMTLTRADVRDNVSALGTTTSTTAAAVSASTTFADATAVNLIGTSSSASVSAAAGQTIGFDSVTSMANTVTFAGTNAAIASTGSSGSLTLKGAALVSASLSGTTAGSSTAPLALTDGNTIASIKALNVSTTGATEVSTIGMTALTSVTQTGAGALTINRAELTGTQAQKLESITTGAGADQVRIGTKTAADDVGTSIVETVNASVSTGDGGDRVVVATTGSGKTTVDLGAGNDTLFLSGIGTGVNSLSGGAGSDVFRIGDISTLATTTISGGSDTDTLRTTNTGTLSFADYTTLSANVSSVETLQLASTTIAVTLDASKISMSRIEFLGSSTNTVTEVSSGQALAGARSAPVSTTGVSFGIGSSDEVVVTNITATSKGYVVDSDATLAGEQTVFGDNLNISMTHVAQQVSGGSAGASVIAKGNALDLSVTALAATTGASSASNVAELNSRVTVSGDIQTLSATLTSARGSGTNTAQTVTSLGNEAIAKLVVNGIALDNTASGAPANVDEGNLDNLTSIKVSGTGDVTIDAGSLAKEVAKLKSIDLSGMTAFADINAKGQETASDETVGGYNNLSKSSVTLNDAISETVILGGGRDKVVTGSTVAITDTVTGFQLTGLVADSLSVDKERSDVLDIGTAFDSSAALGTATHAAKMTVTGSTLEAALLQAASLKGANGTTDVDKVVFNFGGDTYVYVDNVQNGVGGLSDNDTLVKLSGTLNLDLLLQSGVIIA